MELRKKLSYDLTHDLTHDFSHKSNFLCQESMSNFYRVSTSLVPT